MITFSFFESFEQFNARTGCDFDTWHAMACERHEQIRGSIEPLRRDGDGNFSRPVKVRD